MSTTEFKRIIDERTPQERRWMLAYLLNAMRAVPELQQTASELAQLAEHRADFNAGRNRVPQPEALAHWDALGAGEWSVERR